MFPEKQNVYAKPGHLRQHMTMALPLRCRNALSHFTATTHRSVSRRFYEIVNETKRINDTAGGQSGSLRTCGVEGSSCCYFEFHFRHFVY